MSGIGRLRPLERTQYEPPNSGLQSDAPRKLYYWAVRVFGGGFFHLYTRRKRGYKGRKVAL